MIGKRLGNRFEIIEQLGGGGMAVVYKGKDSYLNRLVTIKVLRPEFASNEDFVRNFRREAQSIASLSHPNIVNIHDVGQEDDTQYLVMEYVDGDNLKNLIKNNEDLSPVQAIQIAVQVCDALEHAHENNIIHRDVKPHNILITNTGKAKLTDFGIAREVSAATLTQTDTVVGSVHYLSPEQAQGGEADRKSDIYSLGVVLYEMLTGKLPFTGDTPVAVALKQIKEDPHPLRDINPDLSVKLQDIVLMAMSKNPEKRQSSAGELARQLLTVETVSTQEDDDLEATRFISADDFKTKIIPTLKPNDSETTTDFDEQVESSNNKWWHFRPVTWLALAVLLIGLVVTGALALQNYLNVPEVKVPSVIERDYEDAKDILEEKGLKVAREDRYDAKVPAGIVVDQSKGPEDPPVPMYQDRVITLYVSAGPEEVQVPNLIGKNKQEAEIELINRELSLYAEEPVYDDDIEKGKIIEQNPSAKEKAPKGTRVTVILSLGPEPIMHEMPGLVGKTLQDTKTLLEQINLKLDEEIEYESSEKYLEGYVIAQNPQKGGQVQEGSAVNITLSNGPGPSKRNAKVKFDVVPNDGQEHIVKIQVIDVRGTNEPYINSHSAGEKVVKTVHYYGQAIIKVFIDNEMVHQENMD